MYPFFFFFYSTFDAALQIIVPCLRYLNWQHANELLAFAVASNKKQNETENRCCNFLERGKTWKKGGGEKF